MDADCPAWGGLHPAAVSVFSDLVEYLREPIDRIAATYWKRREGEDAVAQQRVAEAATEQPVLAYYASTPHYLYELSYWEACRDKQWWFQVVERACRGYGLKRVLDFGGGIGGLSLHLNRRGIRCDYLDIAGPTKTYATWRFARHGQAPTMYDVGSPMQPPDGGYDAVVAWDVLEHLFDLEGAIAQIARLLRPGGWFLSKSTFAVEGQRHEACHLKQHARFGDVRRLNELLERHGLRFVGQLKPNRLSRLIRQLGNRDTVLGIRIVHRLKHGGNFLVHERLASPDRNAAEV